MSSEHAQAITEHFPRTEYHRLNYYVDPVARKSARVLWAARDASAEWVRATEAHDWDAVDAAMFNLAVFDKAYELNQAQWPHRMSSPTPDQWQKESNGYIYLAYILAGRQLRDLGHRDRIPPRDAVLDFCRAAMDLCYTPLVDARSLDPVPLDYQLLEKYDPLVRHKRQLDALSHDTTSEAFVSDHQRNEWVWTDEAMSPGRTTDTSDSNPPRADVAAAVGARRGAARV